MLRRITTKRDCGQCYRPFKPFETVHYLGIDNNSFCSKCREKIEPGVPDDENDLGGWIPTLYVGEISKGKDNILKLIELWNQQLNNCDYDFWIDVRN